MLFVMRIKSGRKKIVVMPVEIEVEKSTKQFDSLMMSSLAIKTQWSEKTAISLGLATKNNRMLTTLTKPNKFFTLSSSSVR